MNYLALLGWSYDDETTFFSRDQLVERFDLSRVSRNPAAFDEEKLEWMNGHYIRELDDDDLAARTMHFFTEEGLTPDPALLRSAMPFVKERMTTLTEAVDLLRFLFTDDLEPSDKARALNRLQEESGMGRTKAWQPIRAAVTGSNVSPPLDASIHLLGRERSVARLRASADALSSTGEA